jgi:hypothetical protein
LEKSVLIEFGKRQLKVKSDALSVVEVLKVETGLTLRTLKTL